MKYVLSGCGYRAEIAPELGGALTALSWQGRDILRPAPDAAREVVETACFAMLPFANRIAQACFDWRGQTITQPVLPDFVPHALHGSGWRSAWTVVEHEAGTLSLQLDHAAGDWPWDWSARQQIRVGEQGLSIELELTNFGPGPMPAGLGFHPYFSLADPPSLRFDAGAVWQVDDGMIPTGTVPPAQIADFADAAGATALVPIDHCYTGWTGQARIATPAGAVRLRASPGCQHLHVYHPPGADFVCLEPVTHRPDALHGNPGEMPILEHGETARLGMRIRMDHERI